MTKASLWGKVKEILIREVSTQEAKGIPEINTYQP